MDLIIGDMVGAIKNDDSIRVVINVIVLDPREPGLDRKDALGTRLVDQVVQDHCVCWVVTTIGNVCFVVLENVVFLDVTRSCVDQKNTLAKIAENLVVENFHLGLVTGSDTSLSIRADMVILLYPAEILLSLNCYSIL